MRAAERGRGLLDELAARVATGAAAVEQARASSSPPWPAPDYLAPFAQPFA